LPLAQDTCPCALRLYPRIVSLPLYPAMTEDQVHYVAQCVRQIVESSSRRHSWPAAPHSAASVNNIEHSSNQRDTCEKQSSY
jgi:hypothetical protein